MANEAKICVICGKDCAGLPRIKDSKGGYYHKECHERAKRERDARRAAAAAPTVPLEEPDTFSLLNEIIDDPAPLGKTCPSCGNLLGEDAVICLNCGLNVQSGVAVSVKVGKDSTPGEAGARFQGATSILFQPFVVSMAILVVMLVLFLRVRDGSPDAIQAFVMFASAYVLCTWVLVMLLAFPESVATGFLTLCVPCYIIYFVFYVNDNQWARWLFLVAVLTRAACLSLDMPAF